MHISRLISFLVFLYLKTQSWKKKQPNIYEWSKASEENGIPQGYKLVIKSQGWKEKEREGASTYYEKEDKKIDLISQTDELTLIEDKN